MIRVLFKNMKSSDFIEAALQEKIEHVLNRFPQSHRASITATVNMENSQLHPGPDLFQVKLIVLLKGMRPVVLQKENSNVYQTIAQVTDRLSEVLHRHFQRLRDHHQLDGRVRRWQMSGLASAPDEIPLQSNYDQVS